MVKGALSSPAFCPGFFACSKIGAWRAEAERDERPLLSLPDLRKPPVQHLQSAFGTPGSLGDSEGVPDRRPKGLCSPRQKLLQRDGSLWRHDLQLLQASVP